MRVLILAEVKWGFGKHMGDLSEGMQSHMFFYFWLNFVSYQASIGFTRVSIIFQYLRVFAVTKATRITLICMLIFVALYTLQAVIVTIFSCTPVSDFWNGENPGLCIDIKAFWIFHAVFTISFDILIIYLPIPIIRRLKISRKQRVTLIILFSLGAIGS
ncbi:hypothetical protein SLS56_009682 [Neofusicoccum ribis]|uniref:Rhodopsin domain-containing protein n=1 Tax=Neofusicoccum ribis TaxID=45134 RepID=A0ABR3SGK6_9PEZI